MILKYVYLLNKRNCIQSEISLKILYSMSNIFGSAPQEVPDRDFKMLKALLALIVIQSPYCFQDKLLVKITPKNFTSEDIAIGVLL